MTGIATDIPCDVCDTIGNCSGTAVCGVCAAITGVISIALGSILSGSSFSVLKLTSTASPSISYKTKAAIKSV
jgi:hypothetical protein